MPRESDIRALSKGFIFSDDPKRMVPNSTDMSDLWEIENLEGRSSDILMQDVWVINA
jgi:hypothetical protein